MYKFDLIVIIFLLTIPSIFILLRIIKKFTSNDIEIKINKILNKKENFIVSDAQDFHNYRYLKDKIKGKKDYFEDTLENSPKDDKINYDEKINKNDSSTKIDEKDKKNESIKNSRSDNSFPSISCSNTSINNNYKIGNKLLLPNKISCGFPTEVTSQNYYKIYKAPLDNLEDYVVRGANYMKYEDYVHPLKSNIWILSQNTKGLPPNEIKYKNIPNGLASS